MFIGTRLRTTARRLAFALLLIAPAGSLAFGSQNGTIEGTLEGFGKGPLVVYIEQIPGAKFAPTDPAPVMNQKRNTYVPHVLPVVAGAKVEFHSEDPELHNVYAWAPALKASPFNMTMLPGMPPHFYHQSFAKEGVVRLTCNVHKEMLAFILVVQNPYFTTVEKGASQFRIMDVPPGTYNLRIWGEKLDEATVAKRFPVEVNAAGVARISIAQGGLSR